MVRLRRRLRWSPSGVGLEALASDVVRFLRVTIFSSAVDILALGWVGSSSMKDDNMEGICSWPHHRICLAFRMSLTQIVITLIWERLKEAESNKGSLDQGKGIDTKLIFPIMFGKIRMGTTKGRESVKNDCMSGK